MLLLALEKDSINPSIPEGLEAKKPEAEKTFL
jgi:hypothetical protein